MRSIPVRWGVASRFGVVLLVIVGVFGCKKEKEDEEHRNYRRFACGNQAIDVDPAQGAKPQAVYVCGGNTVTWNPNGHKFLVEFRKDSPFEDGRKQFDNEHPGPDKAKTVQQLTVYEYRITVDTDAPTPHVFEDPQVIDGGGN
jgi:hypothetical protein